MANKELDEMFKGRKIIEVPGTCALTFEPDKGTYWPHVWRYAIWLAVTEWRDVQFKFNDKTYLICKEKLHSLIEEI